MRRELHCISVENMRESDRRTIESYASGQTLMYRAALGVYKAAEWDGLTVIAVGGGNNGGDGYALACILTQRGKRCRVVKLSEKLTEDSGYYAAKAAELGVSIQPYTPGAFSGCDTVVDCLLGTGFQGSLRRSWLTAVEEINACGARVISVDINSGMNGDTGEAETAVRSDLTVTIGFVKQGLVCENAGNYMKRLVVADIGIVLAARENRICPAAAWRESADGDLLPGPAWLEWEPVDVRFALEGMPDLELRPLCSADDAAVAALIRENLRAVHLDIPGTAFYDEALDCLSAWYQGPGRAYLVLHCGGTVVGGVGVAEFRGSCCELQKLYLTDACKGLGLGRALLRAIEEKAREMGYREIYLETHSALTAAARLYERAGYQRIPRPAGVVHSAMDRFYRKTLRETV